MTVTAIMEMFNGQYYWTGFVSNYCPHGFGTAVIQGQTYHNVYALTQNLKKRKI